MAGRTLSQRSHVQHRIPRFPRIVLILALLTGLACSGGCGGARDREANKDKDRPKTDPTRVNLAPRPVSPATSTSPPSRRD